MPAVALWVMEQHVGFARSITWASAQSATTQQEMRDMKLLILKNLTETTQTLFQTTALMTWTALETILAAFWWTKPPCVENVKVITKGFA